MTTSTIETTPATGFIRRHFGWVTAKVPPHDMTDDERNLKKRLFAVVWVPIVLSVVFFGELSLYTSALTKADAEAARLHTLAYPQHAKLIAEVGKLEPRAVSDAESLVLLELQARQHVLRSDVSEPIPMCWLANCKKLK